MGKLKSVIILVFATLILPFGTAVHSQTAESNDGNIFVRTLDGEAKGREILADLQTKKIKCEDLSDENFHDLGEYFMGQMMGSSHTAMDKIMEETIDEKSADLLHQVMGKRLSGCDETAVFPPQTIGFLPMMQMMWGSWSNPFGLNGTNNMMNWFWGSSWGWVGTILMILWWILIVTGIIALIKWLVNQTKGESKSALDILKERYARGEISKGEFEEKKKDIFSS